MQLGGVFEHAGSTLMQITSSSQGPIMFLQGLCRGGFRVVSVWGVSVLLQGIGNGSTVEEPASVGSFEASGCEIFGVWVRD